MDGSQRVFANQSEEFLRGAVAQVAVAGAAVFAEEEPGAVASRVSVFAPAMLEVWVVEEAAERVAEEQEELSAAAAVKAAVLARLVFLEAGAAAFQKETLIFLHSLFSILCSLFFSASLLRSRKNHALFLTPRAKKRKFGG